MSSRRLTRMAEAKRRSTKRSYPKKQREFVDAHRHLYDRILEWQEGGCAICGVPPSPRRKLDMDHDHGRMVLRGLLCHRHNRGLSFFSNKEQLLKAAEYIGRTVTEDSLTHGSVRGRTDTDGD